MGKMSKIATISFYCVLAFSFVGCATFQMQELEKKGSDYSLVETLNYSKKEIFETLPKAIKEGTNSELIIRYQNYDEGKVYAQNSYLTSTGTALIGGVVGTSKIMFGVFLTGDNSTRVKIMQWSSGYGIKDYKKRVMEQIKLILGGGHS